MCWFSCDGPQAQTLLNRAGFSESAPVRRQVVTPELSRAAHALFTAPTDGIRGYLRLQAILYELFRRLITAEPPERGDSPHWIADSIAFMTAHYSEGIGVQDVADRLSLHRAYFSKVFTREVGIPPKKYLEKLRMEQALVLLRSTAYTIEEIALTLGYADPYTFAHAFRRYYGMPPGRWRKSAAAGSPEPMEPDQPDKMTKPGDR
jgi:AraC-like DNA-binding protein